MGEGKCMDEAEESGLDGGNGDLMSMKRWKEAFEVEETGTCVWKEVEEWRSGRKQWKKQGPDMCRTKWRKCVKWIKRESICEEMEESRLYGRNEPCVKK